MAKRIDSYYIPEEFRVIDSREKIELIYKICKYDPERKAWRGIAECVREFRKRGWKLGETTLKAFLKRYPTPPIRPKLVIPEYLEKFRESEIVEEFKKTYKHWKEYLPTVELAWTLLDRKHPLAWTRDDLLLLFNGNFTEPEKKQLWMDEFYDERTGRISKHRAVALRRMIELLRRYKPEIVYDADMKPEGAFGTKGLKVKGVKRTWFLTIDEIEKLVEYIDTPDLLVLFRIGIECGARISSLVRIKVSDIAFDLNAINMYEPKVRKFTLRYFHPLTMRFINTYVHDFIKNELFPRPQEYYERKISELGEIAGLPKAISSHIMKHTFVSLASIHGVSLEVVSWQSGTVPTTLEEYYLARDDSKMRSELIGEKKEVEPFYKLVEKWDKWFRERYEQIKGRVKWIDGFKPK